MKLLILRNVTNVSYRDPFSIRMDTHYADRFISHLTDKADYCGSCDKKCISCRASYNLDFSKNIAGIIDFPAILPAIVEEPEEYLPENVPEHDILIPICINEDVLIAYLEKFMTCRGIVIPQEGSQWVSPNAIKKIKSLCSTNGVEVDFPKPFCAFHPAGGILKEFREQFKLGKPNVKFTVEAGIIKKAEVLVSAPCGATYYTCRGLTGKRADDPNLHLIIDKQLSGYPCTADHAVDRDFGDSITHEAAKIQRDILLRVKK